MEVVPQGTAIYTQTHLLGSSSISGKGKNIVNKREIVQALMDSVQKGDFENAKSMLADDFRFSGPVPEPINNAYSLSDHALKVSLAKPRELRGVTSPIFGK